MRFLNWIFGPPVSTRPDTPLELAGLFFAMLAMLGCAAAAAAAFDPEPPMPSVYSPAGRGGV